MLWIMQWWVIRFFTWSKKENVFDTLILTVYIGCINFKVLSVAIFRPEGTTANTTKFEAWCMPSKATWRIYYTFYFVVWWRKNWENVDAKKMLKYSLLLKHYLLLNETWMTDFSWQTCLACQVLNVGYEKCKMLL